MATSYENTQSKINQSIYVDIQYDVSAIKKLETQIKSGDKTIAEGIAEVDKALEAIEKTRKTAHKSALGRAKLSKEAADEAFNTRKKQLTALNRADTTLLNTKKALLKEERRIAKEQERQTAAGRKRAREIQRRWDKRKKDRAVEEAKEKKRAEARRQRIQREWDLRKKRRRQDAIAAERESKKQAARDEARRKRIQREWDLRRKKRAEEAKNRTFAGGFQSRFTGGTGSFAGGLGQAFGTVAKYATAGIGVQLLLNGLRELRNQFVDTIRLGVQFEAQLADLAAVAGISTGEVEELGKAAFDLAGSTKFSVDEIINLQRELAKLGFSKDEILSTQGAVAGLAQATGESLSTAAQLTGKTLRAFNLDATAATRVANVLTTSVNETALNLETLATALQYVSPIASTFGISLEETNAAIGLLANNGFTASRAGTGLRQVLLTLGQSGKSLTEVLEETAAAGLGVTDAVELVGKRGAPALLALLDNIDEVKRLTEEAKEPFTALVAEAKQLSTVESAFKNTGVAISTIKTNLGQAISELFNFRGAGLLLLDLFTGIGDKTAEIQAAAPVVASLNEDQLESIGEEETSQKEIRQILEDQLDVMFKKGELSRTETSLALQGLDAVSRRLFNEKEINNTIRERQELFEDANDKEIKRIREQFKSGDFEGAEKSIDLADDAAKRSIGFLERKRDAVKKEIEALGDNASEDARLELDIKLAEYNAEIEAEKQFRQQLLDVITDYEAKAAALNNDALEAEIKNAEKRKELYEKIFANSALDPDQIEELRKEIGNEKKLIDAYKAELSLRGVEEEKEGGEKGKKVDFNSILKVQRDLNKAFEEGDVLAIKRLQKLNQENFALLRRNDLLGDYFSFLENQSPFDENFLAGEDELRGEEEVAFGKIGENRFEALREQVRQGIITPDQAKMFMLRAIDELLLQVKENEEVAKKLEDIQAEVFNGVFTQDKKNAEKDNTKGNDQAVRLLLDQGKKIANLALNALNDRFDAELASVQARYDAENDILKSSLESGLITQEEYERKREQLEKKKIDKQNQIEKKRFNAEKAQSLAEIAINTAVAISKIPTEIANPFLAAALIPTIIAGGAIQAGIVAGQKFQPIQYADGGWINGPSHSAGGVPFTVNGVGGFEAEGGEYIINKRAMANPQVAATAQALNSMGKRSVVTGNRIFEDGGSVTAASGMGSGVMEAILAELRKPSRSFVSEKEMMERSNTQVRTDSRRRLR